MPILDIQIIANEAAFNYFASIPMTLTLYALPIFAAIRLMR
ncbi:hypothetical protein ACH5BF_02125 [Arcobacter sp. YIC-464]